MEHYDLYKALHARGRGNRLANICLLGSIRSTCIVPNAFSNNKFDSRKFDCVRFELLGYYTGEALVEVRGTVVAVVNKGYDYNDPIALCGNLYNVVRAVDLERNFVAFCRYAKEGNDFALYPVEDMSAKIVDLLPLEAMKKIVNCCSSRFGIVHDVKLPYPKFVGEACPFICPDLFTLSRAELDKVFKGTPTAPESSVVTNSSISVPKPASGALEAKMDELNESFEVSNTPCGLGNKGAIKFDGFRLSPLKPSRVAMGLRKQLDHCTETLTEAFDDIKAQIDEEELSQYYNDVITNLKDSLRVNWNTRGVGNSGSDIVERALIACYDGLSLKSDNGTLASKIIDAMGTKAIDFLFGDTGNMEELPHSIHKIINDERFNKACAILGVLGAICGTRANLTKLAFGSDLSLDLIVYLAFERPYLLTYVNADISILALDQLACAVSRANYSGVLIDRAVAFMHSKMLDAEDFFVNQSTVVLYNRAVNSFKMGYVMNQTTYNYYCTNGTLLSSAMLSRASDFLSFIDTTKGSREIPEGRIIPIGQKQFLEVNEISPSKMIDLYVESGLGIVIPCGNVRYLADYSLAMREMYIYNKVISMSKRVLKLDDKDIERCISEFELAKAKELGVPEFKLEERQRLAGQLVKFGASALTGPAGSGKTTTAEMILYLLTTLCAVEENEIAFAAPTGKAADRLAETVKRPCKTLHSLFCIFNDTLSIFEEPSLRGDFPFRVLVIDESSMIDTALMYSVLLNVPNDCKIIFLGDIEQLLAIGFGKPFANLLNCVPYVALNVAKRASENSLISRNCKKIIAESGVRGRSLLEAGEDVGMIGCDDSGNITNLIANICKTHLTGTASGAFTPIGSVGTLSKDDIQVVTPVRRKKYYYGCDTLNAVLQNIFNPRTPQTVAFNHQQLDGGIVEYRIGDRVLHSKNMPKSVRFKREGSTFTGISEKGIMNGTMGKIVGFYNAIDPAFKIEMGSSSEEDFSYPQDSANMYYIIVEYKGQLGTNFCILYKGIASEFNFAQVSLCQGGDLVNIELAYALTVHKMQGSQAKLVIAPCFTMGRGTFFCRNMLYTMISRAEKGLYLVGDVVGASSAIESARGTEVISKRKTVMGAF